MIVEDLTSSRVWYFLCGRWFANSEEDGQVIREIPAIGEDGKACATVVNYIVDITTGDRRGAGTDAIVSIAIYGTEGDTGDRNLDAGYSCFERNKTDRFSIEAVDLGVIQKIRVSHQFRNWISLVP